MCGIFGYIGFPPKAINDLEPRLSQLLKHRGPNDHGFESGNGWGLGFRRLSILDLSELGHQPMSTPDGRFWLVFNGEIYNYVELRTALEQQGEKFQSTSDTEVLLRLLARDGAQALSQLNGMFALALVDTYEGTFLLARDRLGKKTLYYYTEAGQLRFASELKALLAWPNAPREIDRVAVTQYLAFGYIPHDRSIFKKYHKLPHGSYVTGKLDTPESVLPEKYWQLDLNGEDGQPGISSNQLEDLHNLLLDATNIRLRSDVPVGIFLSGGIDSGLIAALAADSPAGGNLQALTVSFTEKDYDETLLARATAKHVSLEQRLITQRASGLHDIDELAWFFDEPFGDPSAIPTFSLCQAAAKYGTVFLAGDGGDEAFGGYRKYIRTLNYRLTHSFPASVGHALETISKILPPFSSLRYRAARKSLPDGGFAAAFNRAPIDPVYKHILHPDLHKFADIAGQPWWDIWRKSTARSITTRRQESDYALYLPDDILVKVDRASMAHSIELRSPFLDYRVVEWAARLPRAALLNTKQGKLPLRRLAGELLPHEVTIGGKRGFGAPLGAWFRTEKGTAFAKERLLSERACQRGFWDREGVEHLIIMQQNEDGRDLGEWLWRLLVLDAWSRHYLDSTDFLQGPPQGKTS